VPLLLALLLVLAPDTLRVDLDAVEVQAVRTSETAASAALSVALLARDPVERATEPGASLEAALRALPGLWVADRENFALGERISVRGMGARAGFGVRGVQVVLDDVPLTLADGQAALTIVDPALIRRAELLRGPASTLWGNASGGVLFLSTLPAEPGASARFVGGSFGLVRTEVEAATRGRAASGGLAVSHVRREGYRQHSAFGVTRARGYAETRQSGVDLRATAALEWAPEQQHPGALTAEEWAADPRQAQTNFVVQAAGKDSRQGQAALSARAETALGSFSATAFGIARSLENPLPFAYIDVARLSGGTRLALERQDGPVRWTAGFDTGIQRDDRQNHANQAGTRGALRLDQLETVSTAAGFGRATLQRGPLAVSAGLRHDRTRFAAEDRLGAGTAADGSGSRTLAAWSPSLGASLRLGTALVFASASTAFETPTTTELANRPDGATGFNADLDPQRTLGLETGIRGTTRTGALYYDVAIYRLDVRDQLTAFQGEDGRTFYRNAEAARHDGLEALAEWAPAPGLRLGATYGWSYFAFTEASGALAGNRVPGVPEHRLAAHAQALHRGVLGRVDLRAASSTWADDANTARADAFALLDLRLGHAGLPAGRALVLPFVQLQNMFDARYVGSVALNAQAGRFYEPGAGRAVQAGVSVRLGG
jgi:iron complex outermembrane recepter protein